MNLNTIVEVKRPKSFEDIEWRDGHAFLGGGTWLFSEPQVATDTLVDLDQFGWPALTVTPAGLEIAATCRIVELHDFKGPPDWRAVPLFDKCIDCFLMSFKIWNAATVGGNVVHVAAGRRHDLADGGARRRLHPVAAERQAARRCRSSTSSPACTPTCCRRASFCARSSCRHRRSPKRFAMRQVSLTHHRPLGGSDRRHGQRQRRGFPADHQRRDAAAGASALHQDAVGRRVAPGDRAALAAGRLVPRRPRLGPLQAPRHPLSGRTDSRGAVMSKYEVNGRLYLGRTEARPVPAHLPARPGSVRRQEGLRCRRLRRLHGVAGRQAVPFLPGARLPRRGPQDHHHRGPRQGRRAASHPAGLP